MARILAISSFVAFGHVGLSAAVPVFQRLGHDVIAMPTSLLSNHTGHKAVAAKPVDPAHLAAMLDVFSGHGQLNEVEAVSTGYLPTAAHVEVALTAIERVKRLHPAALIHCDPILGDDPGGIYIDISAARAIKDKLIDKADILTPNAFELQWLAERPVASIRDAIEASRDLILGPAVVAATSVPDGENVLANTLTGEDFAIAARVAKRLGVPHGTGDVFAALLLSRILNDSDYTDALSRAVAGVEAAVSAGVGSLDLPLIEAMDRIIAAIGAEPDDLS